MDVNNNIEILLVEDNPAETRLIMEVFTENEHPVNITGVGDGIEVMNYLMKKVSIKIVKHHL